MERKITFKYDRKDFFGNRVYAEDRAELTVDNLKKAFTGLKKDSNTAIEISGLYFQTVIVTWESLTDFNNDIAYVKFYKEWNNCTIEKMAFTKIKRLVTGYLKENTAA